MTYIRLNKVSLQQFINALERYANSYDLKVRDVRLFNWSRDDPAGVSYMLSEGSTLASKSTDLNGLAVELQTRLDDAVAMNESGITMDDDGDPDTVSYYLPEGVEDTHENVRAYNSEAFANGERDATALGQAISSEDGKSEDGRTVDQILDEMANHQDVPAYTGNFVSTYGVEEYIELPLSLQWHYSEATGHSSPPYETDFGKLDRATGILGHVLGAATHTNMVPEGYDSWSAALYGTVNEEGHRGRLSSLNALLAAPGAVYETNTLTELGDLFEDLPYDGEPGSPEDGDVSGYYDHQYGALFNEGRSLFRGNMDPMYGVMMAMGNNPEAARMYLVPDGEVGSDGFWVPGDRTKTRWEFLKNRTWAPNVGLDALTAAQGGASAERGDDDAAVSSAATWVTARSIEYAVNNIAADKYTDKMKENLSLLIANSSEEMIWTANGGSPRGLGLSGDEAEQNSVLTSLVYRVIDNENAAATIASAAGEKINDNYQHVPDKQTLEEKYNTLGGLYGYLEGLGSLRHTDLAEDNAAKSADAKKSIETSLSVLTKVAGGAMTGPVAPLVWDVGTTVAKPIMVEQLTPEQAAQVRGGNTPGRGTVEAMAYAEAVNSGIVPQESLNHEDAQDQYGQTYSWYNDGKIDLPDDLNSEQIAEVHDWANRTDDGGVFLGADTAIDTGIDKGTGLVLGSDGAGGNDGPQVEQIDIKK